jgi:hypothetical protein
MFVAISETVNFTARAPDVVCEDLTTVQDSIINSPKTFSLVGEVSDIFIETTPKTGLGTKVEKILNVATPYLPARTLSQIQKLNDAVDKVDNVIQAVDSAIEDANEIFNIAGDKSEGTSIKDKFFDFIQRIFETKTIIQIETKSRSYPRVLITGFSYTETNEGDTGDFSMGFKEIRIASIDLFRDVQKLNDAEKARVRVNTTLFGQLESETDKGLSDGLQVPEGESEKILEAI